jgi:hypothetical protein
MSLLCNGHTVVSAYTIYEDDHWHIQWRRLDLDAVDKQWVISWHTQIADRPSA